MSKPRVVVVGLVVIAALGGVVAWTAVPPTIECSDVPLDRCHDVAQEAWDVYAWERPIRMVVSPPLPEWEEFVGVEDPATARYGAAEWAVQIEVLIGSEVTTPCYRSSDERIFCHPN